MLLTLKVAYLLGGLSTHCLSTMNKNILISLFLLIFGLTVGYFVNLTFKTSKERVSMQENTQSTITKNNCIADQCLLIDGVDFPAGSLSDLIVQSLIDGLNDEYKAYATYKAVMDTYGNIRPFVMIARSEQQHINALLGLFEKYGITIPDNQYIDSIKIPGSIAESCKLGVAGEIENIKLYKEKLLPLVKDYPDITQVYTNLMKASEEKHLPAFERCD